ncbi:MAG: HAMP domain-containing histidine kinase [Bacteroidales bacterium]|nr:HAMP domain-containing histidine kinase [Bacteroidales bacterium]
MTYEDKIQKLKEFKNEAAFRFFLLDLLTRMGFKDLIETHKYGSPEFGKDIIGAVEHKFERIEHYAFVVKIGKIKGDTKRIEEIKNQIKQCFEYPYKDIYGNDIKINKVKVITNETISKGAIEAIQNSSILKNLNNYYFVWNENLIEIINEYFPDFWENPAINTAEYIENLMNIILHEFRSPLQEILNSNSYILEKIKRDYNKVDISNHLIEINNIIHLFKYYLLDYEYLLRKNKTHSLSTSFDLNGAVSGTISLISSFAKTDKGITIKNLVPEKIIINTDKWAFQQVLYNLIKNAVIYSKNSNNVEIAYRSELDKGLSNSIKYNVLDIKNWGGTLDGQEKDLIFEKYYRGTNSSFYNSAGRGLGLYVSKQIMEDLNGTLKITKLKGPITFSVYIPIK